MSAARSARRLVLFAVTADILRTPFGFGAALANRPARDYLFESGALFLAASLLAALSALISRDTTLLLAQSLALALVLAALLAGNTVALAAARLGAGQATPATLLPAAQFAAGFALAWLGAFKLAGLAATALLPDYSGSVLQALTVFGFLAPLLLAALLALEWPRRLAGLPEPTYYTPVALIFLALGLLLRLAGAA